MNKIQHFHPSGLSHSKYKALKDTLKPGQELFLKRDAGNAFDQFAIKVVDCDDNHIGWIPKGKNMELAVAMDQGAKFEVAIIEHNPEASYYDCLKIQVQQVAEEEFDPEEGEADEVEPEGDESEGGQA